MLLPIYDENPRMESRLDEDTSRLSCHLGIDEMLVQEGGEGLTDFWEHLLCSRELVPVPMCSFQGQLLSKAESYCKGLHLLAYSKRLCKLRKWKPSALHASCNGSHYSLCYELP
jgi:hypothetical protein